MGSTIGGRTHFFHADASALGGYLEDPVQKVIPVQAPITLSSEGGYASARAENFRLEELVSFKSAYTQVAGNVSKKNLGWTTMATSVIEGLNVGDVFTADRIVAQVITDHPAAAGKYAPRVSFVGTRFENLRIAGCRVDLELDLDLCEPAKRDSDGFPLTATIEDKDFRKRVAEQYKQSNAFGSPAQWDNAVAKGKCHVLCSLVKNATLKCNFPIKRDGHVLHVPEFGKIFLAELIVDCNTYRLSMFRLELGCPTKGRMSGGKVGPNGSTEP